MHALFAKIWIHEPHQYIFHITETFGPRWYGLAYVLGFLGGAWLLMRYAKANPPRSLLPADKVWDLVIALVIGVFLGGRLGYFIFYRPGDLAQNPLVFFQVWEGGMASHGGFIGVALALIWFSRRNKIPLLHISDIVATITSLGLMLGRVANYMNGELWGKPTDGTWGVIFRDEQAGGIPRHPSQLYEAALEGAVLLAFMQWRFWRTDVAQKQQGRLAGEFLALYAVARIVCERFREPDAALIWGLSRGTFYSIFLFIAGAGLIVYAVRKAKDPAAKKKSMEAGMGR